MKKKILIVVLIIIFIVLTLCVWAVIQNNKAEKNGIFMRHTVINGVDCSKLDVRQSVEKLTEEWNGREYAIVRGSDEIGKISKLNLKYDIEVALGKKIKSKFLKSIIAYYGIVNNEITVDMPVVKVTKRFKKQIKALELPVKGKRIETENAYVDMSTREFKIVPEVYGNTISKKELRHKVLNDIEKGIFKLEYREKDFYKKPTVFSNSKNLIKKQNYCKRYLSATVVWNVGYAKIELTPVQMNKMISGQNGNISVDGDAVKNYVSEMASTVEYYYNARNGTSGKALNIAGSTDGLISVLSSGEAGTVKAEFTGGTIGPIDKKSTYVEIDISSQELWLYSKGKVIVDTPIVTGDAAHGDDTPTGNYQIYNKKSPVTLKGDNYDGTKYASKVQYWMPFNGGIGLHDAPWKSVFGGSEYLHNGSHGCVNLPYSAAEKIYSYVSVGTRVIVHK